MKAKKKPLVTVVTVAASGAASGAATSGRTDRSPETLRFVPASARVDRFPPSARIVVLAAANPKKANSNAHVAFALYAKARTVAEYAKALADAGFPKDYARKTLAFDTSRGFVKTEA